MCRQGFSLQASESWRLGGHVNVRWRYSAGKGRDLVTCFPVFSDFRMEPSQQGEDFLNQRRRRPMMQRNLGRAFTRA